VKGCPNSKWKCSAKKWYFCPRGSSLWSKNCCKISTYTNNVSWFLKFVRILCVH